MSPCYFHQRRISWTFCAFPRERLASSLLVKRRMEATAHVRDALLRIRTEYVEMPDLKLTGRQVQRLWNLSQEVCEAALALLLREGFLAQTANGRYVRSGVLRAATT
jgi:hypothetical protein